MFFFLPAAVSHEATTLCTKKLFYFNSFTSLSSPYFYSIPGYSPLNTAGFPDLKFVSPTQGMSPNQGMSPAHLAGNRNATSPGAGNIVLTGLSGMNSPPPGVGGSTDIQ